MEVAVGFLAENRSRSKPSLKGQGGAAEVLLDTRVLGVRVGHWEEAERCRPCYGGL